MRKLLSLLLLAASVFPATAQIEHNFEVGRNLDIFNALYRDLDLYYVDTLDAKKNIDNALLYMLDQLDPYTEYFPADESSSLEELTTGKYAGIGAPIRFHKKEQRCVFDGPFEGMPAERGGVRTGDVVLSIDGKDVGTCTTSDTREYTTSVTKKLRGDVGTTFNLTVKRPGVAKPVTLRLTRQNIERPSVTFHKLMPDSIGYVILQGFTEGADRELRLAIANLKSQGATKLVLDLRGNGGGLMRQAVKIVNFFIPKGREVVRTKGKVKEMNQTYKTADEPIDLDMPIVLLVDYGTASSAEITSGALQDYDRAVVVGRRTYGKGLVQQTRNLPYDAAIKLTTSKYYIPSGRCVQAYDFKHRNSDGAPSHLPDSLCHTFYTKAGRPVKDGGGITPDVAVKLDSLPNLLTYLNASEVLFDYCVQYTQRHKRIAPPSEFSLSDEDYAEFKRMVKQSDFTYDVQSLQALKLLRNMARLEGYGEETKAEFDSLEKKMQPDIDRDLDRWKKNVKRLIESQIVNNYYNERGVAEYLLRSDTDYEAAANLLDDPERYAALLSPDKAKE